MMREITLEVVALIHVNDDGAGLHIEAVWATVDNIVCDDPVGRSWAFPPAQYWSVHYQAALLERIKCLR